MAKQTPAQYLAQHEQLLLDANASSPLDSSEIMLELNEHGKRRTPDSSPVAVHMSVMCPDGDLAEPLLELIRGEG
ncbi:protein CBFA2T3-like [Sinocyclocheilus grahami]|uniref:protein CBFA2T3-like n=1 Tax=Sinocyclocheilus grahami TaxID=75366 RepID=UPI0007AC9EA3|nr:PREDICTED: protein CBFA2T3-like [Sinocyclocheilus grahami]